jgi:hypothetical protein
MNSHVHLANYVLWIAHPVLQGAVVAAMLHRKLHRRFPVFFAYLISEMVMFAVCFPIYLRGSYAAFFYAHWTLAAISLAVGFFVIQEIFADILRPFHALRDLGTMIFTWAGFVMLLVAAVVSAASPASQSPIVEAVLTLQRCVRVIQCGLVLFLLIFAQYLGVSRKQQTFGIMLGFGGFAFVELAVVALFTSGRIGQNSISLINMAAYNLAIITWVGYCLKKEPARDLVSPLLAPQRWDQSLNDIQHPATGDSLIPMFEGMVERAFSRNHGDVSAVPDPTPNELSPKTSASSSLLHHLADTAKSSG